MATLLKFQRGNLQCTECGVSITAACNCGAPYAWARDRAANAVAATPEKSDRAIAAEIGVSAMTVGRARETSETNVTVEKRTGRDGKKRRMPKRKSKKPLDIVAQVNDMAERPTKFVQAFTAQLNEWLEGNPQLSEQAVQTLTTALYLCAEEYERLAQHIETMEVKNGISTGRRNARSVV